MGRSFWLFVTGRMISTMGDGFGKIAMGWLVYELTGSKVAMGALYLAGMVPELIIRLVGAPLTDRLHRTRMMAVLDSIQFLAYLTPLLLHWTGHLSLWHLFLLEAVAGASYALYRPSVMAVVPALVKKEQLVRANALLDGLLQVALVSGPVLAGFAVLMMSSAAALALNALTFAVSALSLTLIALPHQAPPAAAAAGGYWTQLADGFRFFKQVPALLWLTLMLGLSYMGSWAIFSMHAPYVKEHLHAGPEAVGFMQASWPVGFLLGTALLSYIGEVKRRRIVMLLALLGIGVALGGLGLVPEGMVAPALALKVLEGFSFSMFSTNSVVLFQRVVPPEILGRVMSVRMLLAWGGNPLGAFLGGYLGARLGLPLTFVLAGGISVVVGAVGFLLKSLHDVDRELKPRVA